MWGGRKKENVHPRWPTILNGECNTQEVVLFKSQTPWLSRYGQTAQHSGHGSFRLISEARGGFHVLFSTQHNKVEVTRLAAVEHRWLSVQRAQGSCDEAEPDAAGPRRTDATQHRSCAQGHCLSGPTLLKWVHISFAST